MIRQSEVFLPRKRTPMYLGADSILIMVVEILTASVAHVLFDQLVQKLLNKANLLIL